MPAQPDVSIIIVSYNVVDLLDDCLRTIKHYTKTVSYQVIVVDSASSDGSVAMVQKKYPWVELIVCDTNVGFTKANNLGLAQATGKDILYLNPDIELIEDAIGPMVSALHAQPTVGIVACKLLNTDRSLQSTIGRFTSLRSVVDEFILGAKKEDIRIAHPDTPTLVQVALGACLLVRGDLARELKGFDERYYMYNEETDLCLTALKKGFTTLYFPEVAMIHHGSKSSMRNSEARQRSLHIARMSILLFLKKHYNAGTVLVAKLIIALSLLLRYPMHLVLWLLGKTDSRLKLRYYGYTLQWMVTGTRRGI